MFPIFQDTPSLRIALRFESRAPRTFDEAIALVIAFVDHYNNRRLHSAIDFVTPVDKLAGREQGILALREQRLEAAHERRRKLRHELH